MSNKSHPAEPRQKLARLLREGKEELIARWTRRVLEEPRVPGASALTEPELHGELPELLDGIVEELDGDPVRAAGARRGGRKTAREHARERAAMGYGVAEDLRELSILRTVILQLCEERGLPPGYEPWRPLHVAIDERITAAADEMERVARDSGQRLAQLVDASHEAVLAWEVGGGVVLWNRGAQELYGWTAYDAFGKCPHDLLRTEHPLSMAEIERIAVAEGRWEGQLGHAARGGKRLVVESRWVVLRDEDNRALVLEANRDVTERLLAEQARRESEARLRALVDTALDAIVTIDERGTIESWNPSAERLFGYRAEEVVGKNVRVLMPEPFRGEHESYLARYRETGERHIIGIGREVCGRHKNGAVFPIDLSVSETTLGERRLFTGIIRDITERKRAEIEREQVLASERAARGDAERAARLRDEFVATVSHELRTPLNAILGWTTMLRGGRLDAAATAKALEVVERNARAQAELVEDLLDISRIGSGKLRLDVRQVNLAAIVENVIASHLPSAQAKGVRLDKSLDTTACSVQGDPGRLEQIVSNLISNAVKFTPRGGHVHVACQRAESRMEIVVHDTGKGIGPEFLPHVFDRFSQADASLTRQHRGLGLGLTLVKFLVEQHGGTIRAESDGEGKGATFTVSLPVAAVRQPEGTPTSPIEACGSLAGAKVLVVDDEEDARALVRRILEDCEAHVAVAGSTAEALERLSETRPDVMICDIGMPELDGYDLIRAVRARPGAEGGATPAVALTAFARPEDRLRALRAGYQMHLAKPVDQAELIVAVANLTGRLDGPAKAANG